MTKTQPQIWNNKKTITKTTPLFSPILRRFNCLSGASVCRQRGALNLIDDLIAAAAALIFFSFVSHEFRFPSKLEAFIFRTSSPLSFVKDLIGMPRRLERSMPTPLSFGLSKFQLYHRWKKILTNNCYFSFATAAAALDDNYKHK